MNIINVRKNQILELGKALISEYIDLLTQEETQVVMNLIDNIEMLKFDKTEEQLLPILEKVWDAELSSGKYIVVSWNKFSTNHEKLVTFATLCKRDNIVPFCNMSTGIEYQISFRALIGALWKDGATLIEDLSKKNQYTIGIIGDKVINSYNCATRLITPWQLVQQREIDYPSKHNELILDSRYIKEIGEYEIKQK